MDEIAGARWWRFDFHTHTPASADYGKGPHKSRLKRRTPREWLLDFMRAEIDCVAVTDHNSGAWIDRLKEENEALSAERPEGFRELHIFPGVEIAVTGGVHLLAVLDPCDRTGDIDALLGAVGLPPSHKADAEALTEKPFLDVVNEVQAAGGLAIPAHADTERGILRSYTGGTLRDALRCEHIVAMELADANYAPAGVAGEHWPNWSCVLGSDCHHPPGGDGSRFPGSHFTWVKMERPSMDGLRLALFDGPDLSVLRSDVAEDDPNGHASLVIDRLTIDEALYAGRPRPLRARFSPWMSAIIGGRGTGKSTLVEMLRLGLDRTGELPNALRDDFENFARVARLRTDQGALTPGTKVTVGLHKNGKRFRVVWSDGGGRLQIEEQSDAGEWSESPGKVSSRFPVRIFSQKQVFSLADDPSALLRLIDESAKVGLADWMARWRELETPFP